MRNLTLDAWLAAVVRGEAGTGDNRARRRRPERKKARKRWRFRRSRGDSLTEDGEDDEADRTAASDRAPVAGDDGNRDGGEQRHRSLLGLGFPGAGKRERARGVRRGRASWGTSLTTRGAGGAAVAASDMAAWRQCHCGTVKKEGKRRG